MSSGNAQYKDLVAEVLTRDRAPNLSELIRVSSALYHFRSAMSPTEHPRFIRTLDNNIGWAARDQHFADLLVPGMQVFGAEKTPSPSIYCGFHLGSYRLVLPHLLFAGRRVSMIVDRKVFAMQGSDFDSLARRFCESQGIPASNFRIRDTTNASILLSLLRDLKDGYSILIFVDGNLGSGAENETTTNLADIAFLDSRIQCRLGAIQLAKLSGKPLVPIFTKRGEDVLENEVRYLEHVFVSKKAEPDEMTVATQRLWSSFESLLVGDLASWEAWRYIVMSIHPERIQNWDDAVVDHLPTGGIKFNSRRFMLPFGIDQLVVFDRLTLKTFFIGKDLHTFLAAVAENAQTLSAALSFPSMSEKVLRRLLQRKVLVSERV